MLKKVWKVIKIALMVLGALVVLAGVIIWGFLTFSPQFGGEATDEEKAEYAKTDHYEEEAFFNYERIVTELDLNSFSKMLNTLTNPHPNVAPGVNIEVNPIDPVTIGQVADTSCRITWLGHSSFLLEFEGEKILLDPVFGQYPAPIWLLGRKRYNEKMSVDIEDLPNIDAVVISHDHYDHLDYPSIEKLKDKVSKFFVPLGVSNHLEAWGIAPDRIVEMDWWDESQWNDLKIALVPSRHMSGRAITDHNATLWGSWVLQGEYNSIYFSGDGGYGEHFKKIGEKYGPFDIGLMECGQYNKMWENVHMYPEQTVQASFDIKAERVIPIHWGAFTLAPHAWTEPITRVKAEASKKGLDLVTPEIGEPIEISQDVYPQSEWWLAYK